MESGMIPHGREGEVERHCFSARNRSSSRQNHPCCQGCVSLLGVVAFVLGSMAMTLRAVALAILGRKGTPIQQADACLFLVDLVHVLSAEDVLLDFVSLVDLLGRVVEELLFFVFVLLLHLLAGHRCELHHRIMPHAACSRSAGLILISLAVLFSASFIKGVAEVLAPNSARASVMQGEIPSHFITCSLSAPSQGHRMSPNMVLPIPSCRALWS